MDRRISGSLTMILFALSFSGCVTTQTAKDIANPNGMGAHLTKFEESPRPIAREDGPKRTPQAKTEVAFGKVKEQEADSEMARKNPEAQARLREEARRAYQAALKIDPNNLEAQRGLGGLYMKAGDHERALDTYKKAMAKNPKEAVLWYDMGVVHHRRRDLAESVRCFQKALELDPDNREYQKKLGFTLAWMGQLDQGFTYLARAQGAAMAHCNIARVLIERDQHQAARQHVVLALRENRDLPDANGLLTWLDNPNARNMQPQ